MPVFPSVLALSGLLAASVPGQIGVPGGDLERAQRAAFEKARLEPPVADRALKQAAKTLARQVLAGGARASTSNEAVARQLSIAGAWDPTPRVMAVRASTAARALASLAARDDLAAAPATHFGLAVASDDKAAAAVLVVSNRRAFLAPFPRQVQVGECGLLEGRLAFPLRSPRVFVSAPSGEAAAIEIECPARNLFRAEIDFPVPGSYAVEVVAESVKGPEVVALFGIQAGEPSPQGPALSRPEPEHADLSVAEAQVMAAINDRRRAHRRAGLARSVLLDALAEEHAAEMVQLGYFAHVSPIGGDVGQRLERAGVAYERVTENLGEAGSALEAHQVIESSPGHLANVLDPRVDLVGLGTARVRRGALENVLLVEVYARFRH